MRRRNSLPDGKQYFQDLVSGLEETPEAVRMVLRDGRGSLEMFQATQRLLLKRLSTAPQLARRVKLLETTPGIKDVPNSPEFRVIWL